MVINYVKLNCIFAHNKKQNENIKHAISKKFVDEHGDQLNGSSRQFRQNGTRN